MNVSQCVTMAMAPVRRRSGRLTGSSRPDGLKPSNGDRDRDRESSDGHSVLGPPHGAPGRPLG